MEMHYGTCGTAHLASKMRHLYKTQQEVVKQFKTGRSIAVLGGAGSGKTFLLNELLKIGNSTSATGYVLACEMTNNSANRISGCIVHSLFRAKPAWEWLKQEL